MILHVILKSFLRPFSGPAEFVLYLDEWLGMKADQIKHSHDDLSWIE
jgi:hypothetical protein